MIRVSALHYYPIKSCAGTTVDVAQIGRRGIDYDRGWMIVDDTGMFVSQREIHKMCLVRPRVCNGDGALELSLNAPGMPELIVPATDVYGEITVTVWRDQCVANDQGDQAAVWLSAFLDAPVRLVRMAQNHVRQVDQQYALRETDEVGFADGFPMLLISEESLNDLNNRLAEPILMNRFRPNVVVTGCGAFAEDSWRSIQIGSVQCDVVKPCARCVITTVDQETGKAGAEPLKALSGFRLFENRLLFGQNIVHVSPGTIKVGDELRVLK